MFSYPLKYDASFSLICDGMPYIIYQYLFRWYHCSKLQLDILMTLTLEHCDPGEGLSAKVSSRMISSPLYISEWLIYYLHNYFWFIIHNIKQMSCHSFCRLFYTKDRYSTIVLTILVYVICGMWYAAGNALQKISDYIFLDESSNKTLNLCDCFHF